MSESSRKKERPGDSARSGSYVADFIKNVREMGLEYGVNEVFTTSLELTAVSLAARKDPICSIEREKRYHELTKGMTPKLLNRYSELTALMFLAILKYQHEPRDVLGEIYRELNLYQKWSGQYFTPDSICRLMAELILPDKSDEERVTIQEPTCGSGAMIIGSAYAMMNRNIDYRSKSLFIAQDIDIRCVWMCYIQLALYQVPAIVIHGNTLTGEEWDRWRTPGFYALKNTSERN